MASPFEFIKEGLNNIGKFFENLLDYLNPLSQNFILYKIIDALNPLSDNFILKGLFTFLSDILAPINPFSEKFMLKDVLNFFGELLSYINPFSENFFVYKLIDLLGNLLRLLFVPENNPFESLSVKLDEKFAFVNQIKSLFSSLLGFNNYGENVPSFTLTWYGATVAIIDFSLFLNYRTWIHGIILAIAWAVFIFKTYRKLPSIIGGFSQ